MAWSEQRKLQHRVYVQETRQYAKANEVSYKQAQADPEFRYWRAVLHEMQARVARGESVDTSRHGDYSESLIRLGYRSNSAWWNVGESDKIRKRMRGVLRT